MESILVVLLGISQIWLKISQEGDLRYVWVIKWIKLIFIGIMILLYNVVMFISKISTIYYDLLRGNKKCVPCYVSPYTIPESSKYFIKTGVDKYDFLEVDYKTFSSVKDDEPMVLETTPLTHIYLNLKDNNSQQIITTDKTVL